MTPERDIKAEIAAGIADLCVPGDRVASVVAVLGVDEIEARLLISRGRRLWRAKEAARRAPTQATEGEKVA